MHPKDANSKPKAARKAPFGLVAMFFSDVGGNSNMFYVHPYLGKGSNLTSFFSNGLKPPPSWAFLETCRKPGSWRATMLLCFFVFQSRLIKCSLSPEQSSKSSRNCF